MGGLAVCGAAYDGLGIPACIASAEVAATQVLAGVGGRGRMTPMTEQSKRPHQGKAAKDLNDTIRYTMWSVFRLRDVLGESDRASEAAEVEKLFAELGDADVTVRGLYDVAGLRADADLMVWWHASTADELQDAYHRFRRTAFGARLDPVWSQMALHRPAEFNKSHIPAFLADEEARAYVCVYPFVRSYEWYLLEDTERRRLLAEHGMMARDYPDVRANTVSSFALGDYEWLLAFEADDLDRIVDLMRHLRGSETRRHVREEVPFYTGRRRTPDRAGHRPALTGHPLGRGAAGRWPTMRGSGWTKVGRMRASRRWLLLPLGLLLAACGDVPAIELAEPTTADSQRPSSVSSRERPDRELYGAGTVLQKGDGPAMLCLGGVRTSNPPQCEGPPIAGWQWSRVEGEQRSDGVTWGDYVVVGTFDGSAFTPTRRAVTASRTTDRGVAAPEDTPRTTPCPVPEGGWRVLDPATTTTRSLERTLRVASGLEGFGDAWLDQSVVESLDDRHQNDPRRLVLDVAVTGDRGWRRRSCGRPGAARCASRRRCTARRSCARCGPARRRALGRDRRRRARPGRPAGGLRRRDAAEIPRREVRRGRGRGDVGPPALPAGLTAGATTRRAPGSC